MVTLLCLQANVLLSISYDRSVHMLLLSKHVGDMIRSSVWLLCYANIIYDLVPKGVQEKRTEVLENKVERMWVSNAFFEQTHVKSSTSEGRRQCCSSFLRNLTFTVICDSMLQQAHITVLLIMQLSAKPQLILQTVIHMSITKWTVVVLWHTEQHATHGLLQ